MATMGANWRASEQWTVSGQLKDFPNYWNNTSHAQVNQGACLIDLGASYKYDKSISFYGTVQNLTNQSYYDQGLTYNSSGAVVTNSSGTTPALGIPRSVMVGMRASF
jgi:outer membrane receptor protein involved in Fe transport